MDIGRNNLASQFVVIHVKIPSFFPLPNDIMFMMKLIVVPYVNGDLWFMNISSWFGWIQSLENDY
jgi:hypothetical protein